MIGKELLSGENLSTRTSERAEPASIYDLRVAS